jgi:predicted DCC family thiol-disulfide oxidoreductase YuxK
MSDEMRVACSRALHVIKSDGTVLRAGRATLYILERIGWGRFARFLGYPPMIWFVELGYWIVANNRRFFSKFMFRDRSLRE